MLTHGRAQRAPTVFLRYPFTNITLARHPERQRSFAREPCVDLRKSQTIEASRVKPLLAEGSILEPL